MKEIVFIRDSFQIVERKTTIFNRFSSHDVISVIYYISDLKGALGALEGSFRHPARAMPTPQEHRVCE
jgi:hypothetical protein